VAVASAGLYASLHLMPDNHANVSPLSFLQAGCPSCCPTNSVKALKTAQTAMRKADKQNVFWLLQPFNGLLFHDNLRKPAPERQSHSGF